mmetsp:Transcript_23390/g.51680  ORF Transcript_23390/g.51680 Transcript_23390/m.51680 type:complete len:222 (-) Transcript_23390:568-1233(-)
MSGAGKPARHALVPWNLLVHGRTVRPARSGSGPCFPESGERHLQILKCCAASGCPAPNWIPSTHQGSDCHRATMLKRWTRRSCVSYEAAGRPAANLAHCRRPTQPALARTMHRARFGPSLLPLDKHRMQHSSRADVLHGHLSVAQRHPAPARRHTRRRSWRLMQTSSVSCAAADEPEESLVRRPRQRRGLRVWEQTGHQVHFGAAPPRPRLEATEGSPSWP